MEVSVLVVLPGVRAMLLKAKDVSTPDTTNVLSSVIGVVSGFRGRCR